MQNKNYYSLLRTDKYSTPEDIKRAYKRMALRYHPDKNPDNSFAEERFKEIREAYDVLSDPDKRRSYDMERGSFGASGQSWSRRQSGGYEGTSAKSAATAAGDSPDRSFNFKATIEISFEEAAFGCSKSVSVPGFENCRDCAGTGAKRGVLVTCASCKGSGQNLSKKGVFTISKSCRRCRGTGKVSPAACPECFGRKRVKKMKSLVVSIPEGVEDGARLKVECEAERGMKPSNLYLTINVEEHPIFKREESNIVCEIPVTFTQAALGGSVTVPTLTNRIKLKIPPGTQTHQIFRLKERGILPEDERSRGDQLVKVIVETPTHLDSRQRELLTKFADITGEEVNPIKTKFFHKVKNLFG